MIFKRSLKIIEPKTHLFNAVIFIDNKSMSMDTHTISVYIGNIHFSTDTHKAFKSRKISKAVFNSAQSSKNEPNN